jgi:hypothetical protein
MRQHQQVTNNKKTKTRRERSSLKISHERFFVGIFLFLISLQLAQSVHTALFAFQSERAHRIYKAGEPSERLFNPDPAPLYAPDAYRVGVTALGKFMVRTFYVQDAGYVAAAFDLVAAFLSLSLLYRLSVDFSERPTAPGDRLMIIIFFLAILQFPIPWIIPWQRPETLPTALYLALSLFCLAKSKMNRLWLLPVMVATLGQAFVRADVPFIFGVAMLLVSLWDSHENGLTSHRVEILTSALVVFTSGAVQAYLQFIRYPHLSYPPGTNVVQFGLNLNLHKLSIFMIALMPFFLFAVFLIVKRPKLDTIDRLVLVSSALYLPVWFTVGVIAEVRVYVPFLFALSMVTAKVSAPFLIREYRQPQSKFAFDRAMQDESFYISAG